MRIRVLCRVVSYRNSTSNHNFSAPGIASFLVVSYRNSTSNHNIYVVRSLIAPLYLIEILHQTTTTTTPASRCASCILSKFYIKPQLGDGAGRPAPRCILSKFYIKPQLGRQRSDFCGVVSYRNSTSNHNPTLRCRKEGALYLIEILHQTTTTERPEITTPGLYLIEILHQTTTFLLALFASMGCILSKFYIKPQQIVFSVGDDPVVSYRNSTSNHNHSSEDHSKQLVVSYRNSTSNHNTGDALLELCTVVSYRNSTSNHNIPANTAKLDSVVSYRNSTSNHNTKRTQRTSSEVVSYRNSTSNHNAPILLYRHIDVVSYRNSTSNHNNYVWDKMEYDVVSYRNSTSNHNF